MAELDLGRIRFFDKGEHSMETEYVLWDFVTSDGSTYLYTNKTGSTGKALTNGAYWKCLAKRGLSAFEVWNDANGGNKTYQDYIDFLREPAVDAGVYAQEQGEMVETFINNWIKNW